MGWTEKAIAKDSDPVFITQCFNKEGQLIYVGRLGEEYKKCIIKGRSLNLTLVKAQLVNDLYYKYLAEENPIGFLQPDTTLKDVFSVSVIPALKAHVGKIRTSKEPMYPLVEKEREISIESLSAKNLFDWVKDKTAEGKHEFGQRAPITPQMYVALKEAVGWKDSSDKIVLSSKPSSGVWIEP